MGKEDVLTDFVYLESAYAHGLLFEPEVHQCHLRLDLLYNHHVPRFAKQFDIQFFFVLHV